MLEKKSINPLIFREYDIRGVYPIDIHEDMAYQMGLGFGSYVQELGKDKCVVGHDNRLSSPSLHKSLLKGLLETGIHVIDLGLVTTPMYYYAQIFLNVPAGIMITASHNPKDDNGFKFAYDERGNARGDMVYALRDYILEGHFKTGQGNYETFSIESEYKKLMERSLDFGPHKRKIILDCGNGTTSIIARKIYELFPLDFEILYEESDATFPNHHPDPAVESNLEALKKRVLETHADCGLAFDGDGDRLGVIDNNGQFITTDKFMILICRDIMNSISDKHILYDVKCTKALEDEIIRLGGIPFCYRTGNSYTKAKVLEENWKFGGELSGHLFFNDKFPGIDSGLYAGLRLVEILSKTNKSVSDLLEGIPVYYNTPEIKIPTADDRKMSVVERVKQYCLEKGYDILTIDGVKVLFEEGWALIRASNTGPNLTVRFEAKTKERLEELSHEFLTLLEDKK